MTIKQTNSNSWLFYNLWEVWTWKHYAKHFALIFSSHSKSMKQFLLLSSFYRWSSKKENILLSLPAGMWQGWYLDLILCPEFWCLNHILLSLFESLWKELNTEQSKEIIVTIQIEDLVCLGWECNDIWPTWVSSNHFYKELQSDLTIFGQELWSKEDLASNLPQSLSTPDKLRARRSFSAIPFHKSSESSWTDPKSPRLWVSELRREDNFPSLPSMNSLPKHEISLCEFPIITEVFHQQYGIKRLPFWPPWVMPHKLHMLILWIQPISSPFWVPARPWRKNCTS